MSSQVTQICEFECCYLIEKELNAHRYKVEVTVDGPQRQEDYGYIIEFSKLRDYLLSAVPDKSFLFDTTTSNLGRDIAFILGQKGVSITGVAFRLSAEGLCSHIALTLQSILDKSEPGIRVVSARLRETSNSYVSWKPDFGFSTTSTTGSLLQTSLT